MPTSAGARGTRQSGCRPDGASALREERRPADIIQSGATRLRTRRRGQKKPPQGGWENLQGDQLTVPGLVVTVTLGVWETLICIFFVAKVKVTFSSMFASSVL